MKKLIILLIMFLAIPLFAEKPTIHIYLVAKSSKHISMAIAYGKSFNSQYVMKSIQKFNYDITPSTLGVAKVYWVDAMLRMNKVNENKMNQLLGYVTSYAEIKKDKIESGSFIKVHSCHNDMPPGKSINCIENTVWSK